MSALSPGSMQFYDDAEPPLPAADYNVIVTQQVQLENGDVQEYQFQQPMTVSGPHLSLGSTDVQSVYPPPGSQSVYTQSLPHVVLNNRTLPWQIPLTPGDPPAGTPWVALLLFQPDEIVWPGGTSSSGTSTGTQTVTLDDYLEPPSGTLKPDLSPTETETWRVLYPNASVTVVDVAWTAFNTIAPYVSELQFLAHVRQINTGGASILGVDEDGWYSVVIGNRFPSGTGMYIAHLVSLEGFGSSLPGPGQQLPSPPTETVRLISFFSWTFNTITGPDFTLLMEQLSIDSLQMPLPSPPVLLSPVEEALSNGYTALPYETRLGEPTTAWYRGPCIPMWSERNLQDLYTTSAAAMLYDETTGMFDVSFAVAWQTGRQLALANRQFVTSLLSWINDGNSLLQLLDERETFFQNFASPPESPIALEDLRALTPQQRMRSILRRLLAGKLQGAFGPRADRFGLRRRARSLPGLLRREEIERIVASGADPHIGVAEAVRAKRRRR